MSYATRAKQFGPLGTPAVQLVTAVATHTFSYIVDRQCALERIEAVVRTTIVSTAPVVLQTSIIRADGSGTILLPTLIIPAAAFAAGSVIYKNVPVPSVAAAFSGPGGAQVDNFGAIPGEFLCFPGDQVTFAVSTAAAGGGAAGAVYHSLDASESPEAPVLHSNMFASA